MSLAYKLWKIGSVLEKDEIKRIIHNEVKMGDGKEPLYVNVNFNIQKEKVVSIEIKQDSIPLNQMFFTKKLGGTSNSYYLYPNIDVILNLTKREKDQKTLFDKLKLLKNTLIYSVSCFSNDKNHNTINAIIEFIENGENDHFNTLKSFKEGYFIFWLSINNLTFYELMPEIFGNWFIEPVIKSKNAKKGFDAFTNKETTIGYKPEFRVFSYDQYPHLLVISPRLNKGWFI